MTDLHEASYMGNTARMEELIAMGANINQQDSSGNTPLHKAVEGNRKKATLILIKNNADINIANKASMTPFNLAVLKDRNEIAALLIEKGAAFERRTPDGLAPLHVMAKSPYFSPELPEQLKKRGANLNIKDLVGRTPLHIAAEHANKEMAELLCRLGADVESAVIDGNTPLHYAAEKNNGEMIKLLAKWGAHIDRPGANGSTPLHLAARWNKPKAFRALLDTGADLALKDRQGLDAYGIAAEHNNQRILDIINSLSSPEINTGPKVVLPPRPAGKPHSDLEKYINRMDSSGNTLLMVAIGLKDPVAVRFLLENGADPDMPDPMGTRPLHLAAETGNGEIVQLLTDGGAQVDSLNGDGLTPLQLACAANNGETAARLTDAGARIDVTDSRGYSLLHRACINNGSQIIEVLIKKGCKIDRQAIDGNTPLNYALEKGSCESANRLLDSGADIHIPDSNGMFPLHKACSMGWKEPMADTVKKLIAKGADVNSAHHNGNTPLHWASRSTKRLVEYLIDAKADINTRNCCYQTPLHSHIISNNIETSTLLISLGSEIDEIDGIKNSALHTACVSSSSRTRELASVIIPRLLNINQQNLEGDTILHKAVHNRTKNELIPLILKAGGDPNIKNLEGLTPLNLAFNASDEVIQMLIENGGDPHIADNNGSTILMKLITVNREEGRFNIIELLVEKGADVDLADYNGNSAISLARSMSQTKTLDLLSGNSLNRHPAPYSIRDSQGFTDLHQAVIKGDSERTDSLFKQGIHGEIRDRNHFTAMHHAVLHGKTDCLMKLIENKCDINAKTNRGITPLHLAASEGNEEIINILVNNGADKDSVDILGETPIFKALEKNKPDSAVLLFNLGASINIRSSLGGLFHTAVKHLEDIDFFLNFNPQIDEKDAQGCSPLYLAALHGRTGTFKKLLKMGADPDSRNAMGETPLHKTVTGEPEILQMLLDKGADPNIRSESHDLYFSMAPILLLINPLINNSLQNIKILAEKGANLNFIYYNQTMLEKSIVSGYLEHADLLLELGADPSTPNFMGITPLHVMCQMGNLDYIARLIQYGAKTEQGDNHGKKALHFAIGLIGSNHKPWELTMETCRLLLSLGADVNGRDTRLGATPLHLAVQAVKNADAPLINFLIDNGADINMVDNQGYTPLMRAVSNYRDEKVALLLSRKSDPNIRNFEGKTAMDIALEDKEGRQGIIEILKSHNAEESRNTYPAKCFNKADVLKIISNITDTASSGKTAPETPIAKSADPLYQAIFNRKHAEIKRLIDEGIDVNCPDASGKTPLMLAIEKDDFLSMSLLVKNGADINLKTENRDYPLIRAFKENKPTFATYLMNNGADINIRSFDGTTPLIYSLFRFSPGEIKSFFLDKGAHVNDRDDRGANVLLYTCDPDKVRLLIEHGAQVEYSNKQGMTPFLYCCYNGALETAMMLLEKGADINAKTPDGESALHKAAYSGNLKLIDLLLQRGLDKNLTDNSGSLAIHTAASVNRTDVVELFLSLGIPVDIINNAGETPLLKAIQRKNPDIVKLLLVKGANLSIRDESGNSPAEIINKPENREILRVVEYCRMFDSENINKKDGSGMAPLLRAAKTGSLLDVKLLLEKGANPNDTDNDQSNALHWASSSNSGSEIIRALIDGKCNLSHRDINHQTPLHVAAMMGNSPAVDVLLERGAKSNVKNKSGTTPLHWAAGMGQEAVVRILLEKGAKTNIRDHMDKTPMDLAKAANFTSIINLLREAGGSDEPESPEESDSADNPSFMEEKHGNESSSEKEMPDLKEQKKGFWQKLFRR